MSPSHRLLVNLSVLLDRPTGVSVYAQQIVPHLAGLRPTLLSDRPLAAGSSLHFPIPGNLSPAHGNFGHLRRLAWTQSELPKIYRQLQARLIFSPVPEAPLYSRCRSVVMVHDVIPLRFPRRSPLYPYFRYYLPRVVAQAEAVICNSEATARDVVAWCGVPAAKVVAIPLAADRDRFRPLSLPEKNYFLYLGRHNTHKNLHRAIRAFARACRTRDVEFWLAGPQDTRFTPQLRALATELGIADRVKFLDYAPPERLVVLYNQALGFIFPSLWEGFGLPVLEAMACGTPVVTSQRSALPEVAGDAALLVDPENIDAIAAAMKALARDRGLREQLQQAGIARAACFDWAQTGAATAALLEKFL